MPCRAANARYAQARAEAIRQGYWNGLVPAKQAKKHIKNLSAKGIGYKTVAEAANVGKTIILGIKNGSKTKIRKETERKILQITTDAIADRALISARNTWRIINNLIKNDGFSKKEIARRLGYKSEQLKFGAEFITAKNAMKIEKFYKQLQ